MPSGCGCPENATLARDDPRQPLPPQVAAHSSSSSAGRKLLDRACGTGLKPISDGEHRRDGRGMSGRLAHVATDAPPPWNSGR